MKRGVKDLQGSGSELSGKGKENPVKLLKESIEATSEVKKREMGKYEGKIMMSEDFNDPLTDFVEYMK